MKGVKVLKQHAHDVIKLLSAKNLINREYVIKKGKKYVYIPVKGRMGFEDIHVSVVNIKFQKKEKQPKTLREIIDANGFRAFDIIGDIALIEVRKGDKGLEKRIGNGILKVHKNIKAVFAKEPVRGKYRVRGVRYVCGINKTETVHREHGCMFKLDISKVYFSQRLSHERGRIADLVKEGENILVLFGGVAPFAIVIAKKHRNVKVYSIEINPDAHMYALENVRLNKVEDRVFPVQGDVIEVLSDKKFENWADRIIMPLPWNAINFIPNIIHSARKGSMLHIYTFCRTEEVDDVKQKISNLIGRPSKLIYCRRVRTYSPDIEQYVFDFLVNG